MYQYQIDDATTNYTMYVPDRRLVEGNGSYTDFANIHDHHMAQFGTVDAETMWFGGAGCSGVYEYGGWWMRDGGGCGEIHLNGNIQDNSGGGLKWRRSLLGATDLWCTCESEENADEDPMKVGHSTSHSTLTQCNLNRFG